MAGAHGFRILAVDLIRFGLLNAAKPGLAIHCLAPIAVANRSFGPTRRLAHFSIFRFLDFSNQHQQPQLFFTTTYLDLMNPISN